jgi:hypothetical protein
MKTFLFVALTSIAILIVTSPVCGSEEVPYLYHSPEEIPQPFSFVTDNPKFNEMWTRTIVEILSRQLTNGQLIESSLKSNLYRNTFPRSVAPVLLIKSGYYREARNYLDFMWENQKKDGSFWNFFNRNGIGEGIVEEDGGCYVVAHTYLYTLYSGDSNYLKKRWEKIAKAMDFIEKLFDEELGLVFSTAGYSEGNIKGGYDIYQQAVSAFAFQSASRIAQSLGKAAEAERYADYAKRIQQGIFENLFNRQEGRFYFQRKSDGSFFDPPYPAFLVLSYYDIVDPGNSALEKSFTYLIGGPRYGKQSEEMFGLEPFDHEHATGRGFWLGQNGHGWVIPYLLKSGKLDEAARWLRSLIHMTDDRTYLVPEHVNWAEWDADGGEWQGKKYGVLPDSSAWVDPGNLYALSTAMHLVFNIIETDPGDTEQVVYVRVPTNLGTVSVTNLKAHRGFIDAAFNRKEAALEISLSGEGDGTLVVVGWNAKAGILRDGVPYDRWSVDQSGALRITTDFKPHRFTIRKAH